MGGYVTSAGWQVTLCDPIRHVSSRSGVTMLHCELLYSVYFTTLLSLSGFSVFSGNMNAFSTLLVLYCSHLENSFFYPDYQTVLQQRSSVIRHFSASVTFWPIYVFDMSIYFSLTCLLQDGDILPPEHFPPSESRPTYMTGLCL